MFNRLLGSPGRVIVTWTVISVLGSCLLLYVIYMPIHWHSHEIFVVVRLVCVPGMVVGFVGGIVLAWMQRNAQWLFVSVASLLSAFIFLVAFVFSLGQMH